MAEASARPVGMIYPPGDIKTIVDKTAEHVARSGEAFQQLIREKYEGNAKFSFIYHNDPYYAYYSYMVEQFKSGKAVGTGDDGPGATSAGDAMDTDGTPQAADGSTESRPPEPDPQQFVYTMPAVSARDLDVMKLTAQFVAQNGPQFMANLAQREASNYQFDFLSPGHSLFGYFRQLVDQYALVLAPPEELRARLRSDAGDKFQILGRAKQRMEWAAYEDAERKQRAAEAEQEKEAFLSIDWHDFVIVGAVEFVEEDAFIDLPPPLRLQDLKSMSLEDKHRAATDAGSGAPAAAAVAPAPSRASAAVQPVGPGPSAAGANEGGDDEDDDDDVEMDMEDDEDDDVDAEIEAERRPTTVQPLPTALGAGPMKIRKDYVPNLRRGPQIAQTMLRCQLCQLEIPTDEFEEHIRVELIDPRWKEQKLVYERKIRDSNLVNEGVDIAHYLKQLAQHRTEDGAPGDTAGAPASQGQVYWDGHSSSAGLATRRARQSKPAGDRAAPDQAQRIGPQLPPPAAKRHKN
ncbi:SF3a splicing factor complex subunit [Coemansia nantahalensis]|uniref:SF3a splicing factor complex subunit n=1 Tax=Coemansia nantahalensis TaxID=2789366 RepID=A0ACC1K377_9FUNG|nr:SF3a splicing factor complex subunit [Coemansia nantahalensis]